jgi:RNase P subunit RPR2
LNVGKLYDIIVLFSENSSCMDNIIKLICNNFKVKPTDIAKAKRGDVKEYTYQDILYIILLGKGNLAADFPELSKDTVAALLKKIFPGKTKVSQQWRTYLISTINMKRCSKCTEIKPTKEFSVNAKEPDGLRTQCRVCTSGSWKAYYAINQEDMCKRTQEYYQANKGRRQEYNKAYYEANTDYYDAHNAVRRARELDAAVAWADIEEIDRIYANKPAGYHVDHIIPLQGKLVCGLHVEHNLQYLTKEANLAKSNKFNQDNYEHTIKYKPPYRTS